MFLVQECQFCRRMLNLLKGCVHYIFASLFFMSKREHFVNKKKCFHFTSKVLFVLEIIKFNFSDIQMSWRHQMSKHETRNIFYRITWEVNTVCWWNLTSLCRVTKEQFLTKKYVKNVAWKLVPGSLIFKESLKKNIRRSVCWFWQVLIVLLIYI